MSSTTRIYPVYVLVQFMSGRQEPRYFDSYQRPSELQDEYNQRLSNGQAIDLGDLTVPAHAVEFVKVKSVLDD